LTPFVAQEAAVLQELQHDNIVALLDVIANDSSIEFVFELMDMDMKAYLEQLGRVRMHDMFVWEFSRQMFSGLEFLHRNGVVHRDLKPHNLLLSNKQGRGRFPRLKIADFGLSRFVTEPISSYSSEMVTLWYRAPEILLQARTYGTEIDIWSAGCIICEFASGVPLLPGADAAAELELMVAVLGPPPLAAVQLMKAHAAGHMLDEISEIVEDTPLDELVSLSRPGGLKLVKWCLEYLPGDRCSAMQALSHTVFSHKQ
jgi:serine/threonine protein kinase